jgi:nucleoside-diphosphate-sugar epimerase
VLQIANLICRLAGAGVEPDVRGTGTPEGEISRQWVDSSKLRAATGWAPRVDLEEGLRRTIEWYRTYRPSANSARSTAPWTGSSE